MNTVVNERLKLLQPVKEVGYQIQVDYRVYASGRRGHGHGHPAAEQGGHARGFRLHVERVQIMRDCQQVNLRRQLICRMSPVGICKWAELAGLHERLQLALYGQEFRVARFRRERGNHVHVIQRRQVVKPEYVRVQELAAFYHVPQYQGVVRYLHLERVVQAHRGGMAMGGGADAAYPLGKLPGVPGVSALENYLESPEESAGSPGVFYLAPFNLDFEL